MKSREYLLNESLKAMKKFNQEDNIDFFIIEMDNILEGDCLINIIKKNNLSSDPCRSLRQEINNEFDIILNKICSKNMKDSFSKLYNSISFYENFIHKFNFFISYYEFEVEYKETFIHLCLSNKIDINIKNLSFFEIDKLYKYRDEHKYIMEYINNFLDIYVKKEIIPLLTEKDIHKKAKNWTDFIDNNTVKPNNIQHVHNFDYSIICEYLIKHYSYNVYEKFIKTAKLLEKDLYFNIDNELSYYKKGNSYLKPIPYCQKIYKYDLTVYADDKCNCFNMEYEKLFTLLKQENRHKGLTNLTIKDREYDKLTKNQERIIKEIIDKWNSFKKSKYSSIADYYLNNFDIDSIVLNKLIELTIVFSNINNKNQHEFPLNIFKKNYYSYLIFRCPVIKGQNTLFSYIILDLKEHKDIYLKYTDDDLYKILNIFNKIKRYPLIFEKNKIMKIKLDSEEFEKIKFYFE